MQFLGCLLMILFGIVILIYGAIRNIFYAIFGQNQRTNFGSAGQRTSQGSTSKPGNSAHGWSDWIQRRKQRRGTSNVFTDDVGEYVDYEEVK